MAFRRRRGLRENASFADDGKEYEFLLARQTMLWLSLARGLEGGNFAQLLRFDFAFQ